MALWFVALGSAVGGLARYALTLVIQERAGTGFPLGTLVVNISGSLLLGFVWRYAIGTQLSPETRLLLTTGFCGGFTTFSTFTYETAALMESGQYTRAGSYVLLSVVVSLLAVFAGFALARAMLAARTVA